jgi:multimeric flavodoxin WrbA
MKVLGVLGSPRIGGNSDILLEKALEGARDGGAQVERIVLAQKRISGCLDCDQCDETGVCVIQDDMEEIYQKILQADSILHSVPVYFWSMTSQMKAYLDRWCAFFDARWRWHKHIYPKMKGKGIGLITVCGDPDVHTGDPILHSFKNTADFSKLRWIGAVQASAGPKGEIQKDQAAKQAAYELGKRAAQKNR